MKNIFLILLMALSSVASADRDEYTYEDYVKNYDYSEYTNGEAYDSRPEEFQNRTKDPTYRCSDYKRQLVKASLKLNVKRLHCRYSEESRKNTIRDLESVPYLRIAKIVGSEYFWYMEY